MANGDMHDIADSTDWLSTSCAGVAAVEAALRCQVCKDFYKTPMLTSCMHTFCSICIRRALSNDNKCPMCRSTEQELKLRSNHSMEEAVDAFVKTRPALLDLARHGRARNIVMQTSPKRKKAPETEDTGPDAGPDAKRPRTSARLGKARGSATAPKIAEEEFEVVEDSEDEDYNERTPAVLIHAVLAIF